MVMERQDAADEWDVIAGQVRRDLIIALSAHLEGPRGNEAVEQIILLEGN